VKICTQLTSDDRQVGLLVSVAAGRGIGASAVAAAPDGTRLGMLSAGTFGKPEGISGSPSDKRSPTNFVVPNSDPECVGRLIIEHRKLRDDYCKSQ
jgi:hypothetical protein